MKNKHPGAILKCGSVPYGFLLCVILSTLPAYNADAREITYTGFLVTDGQIGSWAFHNARVYLSFESDTKYVRTIQVPNTLVSGTTEALINPTGKASVRIVTAQKTVHATFLPDQIFVDLDHGTLPGPFKGGRGVGFGSFSASAQGGIEVGYPLGIEDGTIDWGDVSVPSTALTTLSNDLKHGTAFSGRAWSCIGFPDKTCPTPTHALKTDKGDLYIYQPYASLSFSDVLNGGFFSAKLGEDSDDSEHFSNCEHSRDDRPSATSTSDRKPITYTGAVISNVKLGKHHYERAQVYISFDADSGTVVPFTDATSAGYLNPRGRGRLEIISGETTACAEFEPHQLYVFFDKTHGSVGFGSSAGGRGYPFAVTRHEDPQGLTEDSTIGAITDILAGAPQTNYTPATATLVTDLTNPTVLSGAVSSCVAFDPVTSICTQLRPIPLKTSAGNFYLYEPYTDDETGSTPDGTHPFSINWGVFWTEVPASED